MAYRSHPLHLCSLWQLPTKPAVFNELLKFKFFVISTMAVYWSIHPELNWKIITLEVARPSLAAVLPYKARLHPSMDVACQEYSAHDIQCGVGPLLP